MNSSDEVYGVVCFPGWHRRIVIFRLDMLIHWVDRDFVSMLRDTMYFAQVVSLVVCVGAGELRLSTVEALPDTPSSIRAYMKIYKLVAILVRCPGTDKSPLVVHISSCAWSDLKYHAFLFDLQGRYGSYKT